MGCWIHPEQVARSFARRNDERPEWRAYHRGVVRLGIAILKERRDSPVKVH